MKVNNTVIQNSLSLLLNIEYCSMANQNSNYLRVSMNAGAFLGLVLSLYTFVLYKKGILVSSSGLGIVNYILILAGLFYAVRYYRDKFQEGYISYSEAVKFSVVVSLFASILLGFFTYILYKYIDVSLMGQMFEFQEKTLLDAGTSEEEVEKMMELVKIATTPGLLFFTTILGTTIVGTIISLINSIFLKRIQNPFDKAMSEIKEDQN